MPISSRSTVQAGSESLQVHIDYERSTLLFGACVESTFPQRAVIVKADWRRAQFGALLPAYDTSGTSLQRAMSRAKNRRIEVRLYQ